MDPQAPARPPQSWERQAARGAWGEAHHGHPLQPRRGSLRAVPRPRPGSWDGGHPPGHQPRRDAGRLAARAERYESSYPSRPYSRQGYEDPHWQYPAASYGDDYTYQSYQWQPTAWQSDRDLRQWEHYGKSTNYQDQHYYKGYHPNLAASSPGPDRKAAVSPVSQSGLCFLLPLQPSDQPSVLLQYRESGLSSSGYELSQYIRDGADHYDPALSGTWGLAQAGRPLVSTPATVVPLKFSVPHTVVCFGAGGQLVMVCPHHPAKGQLAFVELHSLEVVLHGTKELEELQAFPGPLAREDLHKVDVMTFCQQKIATSCDLSTQGGRDSCLLWKLLVLLCRQNGSMVGSDTAELLMEDCRHQKYKRQNPAANVTGLTDDEWMSCQTGTLDLITGDIPPVVETQAQIVEKFTKLLYYGRKKDALVWAMRNHLWGHALFLSSKMDPRTYSWVLSGFTSTLVTNDPLQTLFQLMSGRIPQAALVCEQKWGDWDWVFSELGGLKAMLNTGKGSVEAAHFCYLMADIPFGYFGMKADRMVLLGSSHRQGFAQFARMEAIQRMEIFEYCQRLRQPESFLLPFQVYKLLYASLLVDYGLPAQALQYCEQIATVLLSQDPSSHPVLAQQVMKLAERLKLSDPLLLEMPEQDQMLEPDWLVQLRDCCREWEVRRRVDAVRQSVCIVVCLWQHPPPHTLIVLWGGSSGNTTWQLHLQCQEGLKARARTVSESSTVSLEDDSWPSSESVAEDTAEELASNSGFRWFGWFRSRPTKETSSRAVSEAPPDCPTLELQVGDKRLSTGLQGENAFAVTPLSIDMKGSWESAGEQVRRRKRYLCVLGGRERGVQDTALCSLSFPSPFPDWVP
uniref:Protein transport protein sec16 n=1 Tax=Melopsittacus undulatus TaxID=13146 RepID=A0A8V5FT82_MELUD